jgi:hypothetical protein
MRSKDSLTFGAATPAAERAIHRPNSAGRPAREFEDGFADLRGRQIESNWGSEIHIK